MLIKSEKQNSLKIYSYLLPGHEKREKDDSDKNIFEVFFYPDNA